MRAWKIRNLGRDHEDTLTTAAFVSNALRDLGRYSEAEPLLRDEEETIVRGVFPWEVRGMLQKDDAQLWQRIVEEPLLSNFDVHTNFTFSNLECVNHRHIP